LKKAAELNAADGDLELVLGRVHPARRTFMKSQPFPVIELPAIAPSSGGHATDDIEGKLVRPNSLNLEAFSVGVAWAFACAVCLLIVLSVLLVAAGYAGSTFSSDLQPNSASSSWGR
jgi:hypothetical protein